jgi:hypothetical protein
MVMHNIFMNFVLSLTPGTGTVLLYFQIFSILLVFQNSCKFVNLFNPKYLVPGTILLPMFEAALAGEISYGQNMSVPRVPGTS